MHQPKFSARTGEVKTFTQLGLKPHMRRCGKMQYQQDGNASVLLPFKQESQGQAAKASIQDDSLASAAPHAECLTRCTSRGLCNSFTGTDYHSDIAQGPMLMKTASEGTPSSRMVRR